MHKNIKHRKYIKRTNMYIKIGAKVRGQKKRKNFLSKQIGTPGCKIISKTTEGNHFVWNPLYLKLCMNVYGSDVSWVGRLVSPLKGLFGTKHYSLIKGLRFTYRVCPENCVLWDRWILLIKRVYTKGTVFTTPAIF